MSNPMFNINEPAYTEYLLYEYVKEGGNRCPNPSCKSDQIEGGGYDGEGIYVFHEIVCLVCGSEWEDVYKLYQGINLEFGDA